MNEQMKMVQQFHETFGAPVGGPYPAMIPRDRLFLAGKMLLEEVLEFIMAAGLMSETVAKALHDQVLAQMSPTIVPEEQGAVPDMVEMADALGDIKYIALGREIELGLQGCSDALFAEIHASNMSKAGPDGKAIFSPLGKVMKGPNYRKPDIAGILQKALDVPANPAQVVTRTGDVEPQGRPPATYYNRPDLEALHEECRELGARKCHDYGKVADAIGMAGIRGVIVRMLDKQMRLLSLTEPGHEAAVKDEGLEDTLKDMVNYASYAILLKRGLWNRRPEAWA